MRVRGSLEAGAFVKQKARDPLKPVMKAQGLEIWDDMLPSVFWVFHIRAHL